MLLKSVMWNIFQDTGRIDAYLFYRNCNEEKKEEEFHYAIESEQSSKQFDQ